MFPFFTLPFTEIRIYTFGLGLVIAFACLSYMIAKMCKKSWLNSNFFIGNALLFVFSTFFFSRLIFVIAEWRDYKYLVEDRLLNFFIMTDYNMSFVGGVLWFFLALSYKLYRYQQPKEKYLDVLVLSFLFSAIVGYIAAFLGGQIYGTPTNLPIGIVYRWDASNIPYTSAIIPLALFYSLGSFILFSALYILKEALKIPGFIGYMGIGIFSILLFCGEFFSGNEDIFRLYSGLNLTQISALIGIFIAGKWLKRQIAPNHL